MQNGKVLIVGGETNIMVEGIVTTAVETYDPVAKTFRLAASLSLGRDGHSATLLRSGKVLVAGGHSGFGAVSTPEIYDPNNDSWTPAAVMHHPRVYHAAVLLADGRVLVTGGKTQVITGIAGQQNAAPATLPAEIYDPGTDTWADGPMPMLDRPVRPTATLLASGKVLVIGGQYLNNSPDQNVERGELYDPAANTWTPAAPETRAGARQYHASVKLADGRVLVAGGMRNQGAIAWTNLYDPVANSWTLLPNTNTGHCGAAGELLRSGRVLVFGDYCGFTASGDPSAEEFDPTVNRWLQVASLPSSGGQLPAGQLTSVRLQDGTVLAIGGYYVSNIALLFDPE